MSQTVDYFINYHKANSKKNTIRNQVFVLTRFLDEFADRKLKSISSDEILSFFNRLTKGQKQTTKRIRYANLKTFFNFIINTFDIKFNNPCDTPALKKLFRDTSEKSVM